MKKSLAYVKTTADELQKRIEAFEPFQNPFHKLEVTCECHEPC